MPDTPTFGFETPEESPGFVLWLVSNQWQRQQRAALKDFDITHGQFVLLAGLAWLEETQTAVSQVDLANHTGIDVMMTSDLVRKLEAKDLLRRETHPDDSRAKAIKLTDQGRDFVKKLVKVVEAVDHKFFSVLGPDVQQLLKLMLRLRTTLENQ